MLGARLSRFYVGGESLGGEGILVFSEGFDPTQSARFSAHPPLPTFGKRPGSQENRRTIREVVMNFWAQTIAVMIASITGGAVSHAAELIVLASQGNLPGVNEVAAAFARASGHKVTVLQEVGQAMSSARSEEHTS